MEPFTLRCETCQAKLRVRDERVLGQIHECPRCGSMVQIVRPARISAAAASVNPPSSGGTIAFPPPAPPQVSSAASEVPSPPPVAVPMAAFDWPRVVFWMAGGAALFIAGGLVGAVLLRGQPERVASVPEPAPAEEVEQRSEDDQRAAAPAPIEARQQHPIVEPREVVPQPEPQVEVESASQAFEEVAAEAEVPTPPVEAKTQAEPEIIDKPEPAKTLVLEPVSPAATMGELAEQLTAPAYATEFVAEGPGDEARPRVANGPHRQTNVRDQLALSVAAMDIQGMPLASFVEMISEMAAVPIALDDAVLRSAGATPKTKITVRAEDETVESLLTKALAAHRLAWEERDGQLVIVANHQ